MERSVDGIEDQESIRDLAKHLRAGMPSLSDLSRESLEEIVKSVVFQRLAREMDFEISVAGIDKETEAALFLEDMARRGSKATQKVYAWELGKLDGYCSRIKTRLIEFTPLHADNYILHLISQGYSSASIALAVSVASSFCNFMERRHSDGVTVRFRNPFRGTRIKPRIKARKPLVLPTEEEVQYMLKKLPPRQASMLALMSGLGLRCGALSTLVIRGNEFSCFTKGKELVGTIDSNLLAFLRRRLRRKSLFTGMSVPSIKMSINYHVGRMFKNGEIKAHYSCHDFRHYFAIREYAKDKDIWRVSRLLNHASLASTEKYLRGIGLPM